MVKMLLSLPVLV